MRRLLTWLLVTVGIAALVRRLRRRARQDELAPATSTGEDPADELRRKLAATKAEEEPEAAPAATVEGRREEVHGQGRSVLDEMRESDES
jgi:hypothetical protein